MKLLGQDLFRLSVELEKAGRLAPDAKLTEIFKAAADFVSDANRAAPIRADERRQFDALKSDTDQIALFFRHRYASEIAEGHHAGLTLGQIVIRYLAVERGLNRATKHRITLEEGQKIVVVSASCRCGGSHAWMKVLADGTGIMVGCVCHHVLVSDPADPASISVFEVPRG